MQNKINIKIFNFRSILFLFILSMFCIYFGFKATINLLYYLFLIIPITFLIFLIFKKKYILLVISIILLTFLSSYTYIYTKNYENHSYDNTNFTITGKIYNIKNYTYGTYLTLSNVILIDNNNSEHSLNGKVSLSISEPNENYDIGYNVLFNGKISPVSILNESEDINFFNVKNNIRYKVSGQITGNEITFIKNNKPINQTIKDYNKKLLISNFGETKGNIAYALIYGDRADVDIGLMDTFKYSGVVHIFAVSGLHISIIVAVIYFVLKKLKCNNIISLIITSILLLFYCYLCSFSASVVRASLMTITFLFSKVIFRKNDILNTLSLSGLIILVSNPFALFDAGFQMSFTAVFGIIIFMDLFKRIIKVKNIFLKKSFMLIAVSISTQLALFPLFAKYYGYYSTLSIIANLITLPIFSIFYPIFFIINLLCVVFNFLGFLYVLPSAMLSVIIYINKLITYIPFGKISLYYCGGIITTIYYCFLFLVSKYTLINKKLKPIIVSISFVLLFSIMSFNSFPYVSTKNSILVNANNSKTNYSAILSTSNNQFYLINPTMSQTSLNAISKELNSKRINKINGIIFSGSKSFKAKGCENFLINYNSIVFLPTKHEATINLQQMNVKVYEVNYNQNIKVNDNLFIKYYLLDNEFFATLINLNNFSYLEVSINAEQDDYLKKEAIENFVITELNYQLDCVKINDTINEEDYYKSFIKANKFIFNQNDNEIITI